MKKYLLVVPMILTGFGMSTPSFADDPSFAHDNARSDVWKVFQGAPKVKTANGNYWKIRGRVLWDWASISETRVGGVENSFNANEFRTARIGITGEYGNFKYKAEIDLAGGVTDGKAVNVIWTDKDVVPFYVKVGQMRAGNTMEESTSSLHSTFIERGMITDAVGLDRRLGVELGQAGDNYSWMVGAWGNSANGIIDGSPGNTILAARASYAPILEKDKLVHIGAFVRRTATERGAPSRSARWGPALATERIQPILGDNAVLYGAELATAFGPFHTQAELIAEDGDIGSVSGGFVQAGYFLTGETRGYKAGAGKFDRTKPSRPLSKGGFGAWEIAARFDTLDARSAGDEKADTWTLGLTWYPESHLRVKINYTDASADTFSAKGLYTRLQIDW